MCVHTVQLSSRQRDRPGLVGWGFQGFGALEQQDMSTSWLWHMQASVDDTRGATKQESVQRPFSSDCKGSGRGMEKGTPVSSDALSSTVGVLGTESAKGEQNCGLRGLGLSMAGGCRVSKHTASTWLKFCSFGQYLKYCEDIIPQGRYIEATFGSLMKLGAWDVAWKSATARHEYDSEAMYKRGREVGIWWDRKHRGKEDKRLRGTWPSCHL